MSNPIIAKTGEDRYCLVKVWGEAKFFLVEAGVLLSYEEELQEDDTSRWLMIGHDELPSPGNWQIVGIGKDLKEENLTDIIPEMKVGNRFSNYNGDYPIWYYSRRESLFSFLRSHGADENYLILKEVK